MKAFLKKYQSTIISIILVLIIAIYPLVITLINPPPSKNELTLIHAKILEIKKDAPNMQVLLSSGEKKVLYFPNTMFTIMRGEPNFVYLEAEQRNQLKGCNAQLAVKKINWLVGGRLRIWEIVCGETVISYEQFSQWYATSFKISAWLELFYIAFCFLIILIVFLKDRRK